jgi:type II secretory ATPase GspE/PulE/Tfp pilus assembly ATPase PilB-like protein
MTNLAEVFHSRQTRSEADPQYVPDLVDALLKAARAAGASDVHLVPQASGLAVLWRMDGVLQPVTELPAALAPRILARLKVLAQLLTYKTDIPQEGRIGGGTGGEETRLSTFPTLFGEKAVARLLVGAGQYHRLRELGLPDDLTPALDRLLDQTSGVMLVTGPAGSGKTTTAYALLRELADKSAGGRSLVSLEDPIEVVVPGVAQSQVNPTAGFDMPTGLRSLMRQDPEVIFVGEIRDAATAEVMLQAALTGHLVLTTFHAASAAGAINRLSDMGLEPYLLRSTVQGILSQRLLRRLCECAEWSDDPAEKLGLPVSRVKQLRGCAGCHGTGYRGRFVLAELLEPQQTAVSRAILSRVESAELESRAVAAGMQTLGARALWAIEGGVTSPAEVWRTLGHVAVRESV